MMTLAELQCWIQNDRCNVVAIVCDGKNVNNSCIPIGYIYTIILLKSVCLSVGVRKLQVAILALSSREMYLTVHIV